MKQLFYTWVYRTAIACKKVIFPLIPQGARKKLKKRVLDKAFSLENVNVNAAKFNDPFVVDGINLIGYARAEMGIGESCRLAARAISTTDVPFDIINFGGASTARVADNSWAHKESELPRFNLNILHVNAEQMVEVYTKYGPSLFNGRYNIGYWHWELPIFPDEWLDGFKFAHEIWAPTKFVADSISVKSPIPVKIIPHGIEVKIVEPRQRSYFKLPVDPFLFLTMYDMNSFQERKNPMAAIKAFQHAFAPDDMNIGLIIKVNNASSNKEDLQSLKSELSDYKNIYFITEILSRNDTNALINAADSFVSLHRSEGFGLGLAEAMYLGKPAIGTNWSANIDFMTEDNSCLVDYKLIELERDYGPYQRGQVWADPSIDHAARYMRKLYEDQAYRAQIALKGQEHIRSEFSPSAVGRLIVARLQEINNIVGGPR
ncbi:glycosyltransferase family 4 protein [Cohnella ginsengisoli]|uniref:Glycosyltransferase family 4 protein n=1 Tax=Cohnella ginsengisoli TaxID=425004 RepID=A0A9X4QQ35_9BACL|nr:glycosyltransferase family 4 protein [Cohnella ginsengisoli]MDG0794523.1 glycosyltransferase family 4 protein [Cohnella ginsengisoli]